MVEALGGETVKVAREPSIHASWPGNRVRQAHKQGECVPTDEGTGRDSGAAPWSWTGSAGTGTSCEKRFSKRIRGSCPSGYHRAVTAGVGSGSTDRSFGDAVAVTGA